MKFFFSTFIFSSLLFCANAQNVGINSAGTAPNSSAGLDVDYTNMGVLIPRVSLTQTSSASPITSPAASLVVYNSATVNDVSPGFYYWDGTKWLRLLNGTGSSVAWMTNGNAASGSDFIGTTTNFPFIVKTNNTEVLRVLGNGTFKITGTTITSPGIWMNGTVTAAASTAYGILSRGTLTAVSNSDGFLPFSTNLGNVNTGTFTGLTFYGGHFDGASWTKTGTGTIDNGFGVYVTAPSIATNNYAGVFTGGNVGVGTVSPIGTLHVASAIPNYVDRGSNVVNEGACFIFRKARGTVASPSAVQNGDELAKWLAGGYDGTSYVFTGGMSAVVNGAVSSGTIPTDLVFGVNNVLMGNPTSNEAMRITYGKNVGIGTTNPSSKFEVVETATTSIRGIIGTQYVNSSIGSRIMMRKARGTNAVPLADLSGDNIALLVFSGYDGSSFIDGGTVESKTTENWSVGANGTNILFTTTANGTSARQIRMTVDQSGYVGIGANTPSSLLDVMGSTGYAQRRVRTSYTPSSTADVNGNIGDIAWDDNYFYVKTNVGWKRTALSTF